MGDWYYKLHGRTQGPVTASQIKLLIEQQRLGASDEVREDTAKNWVAVAQVDWKQGTDDSSARTVETKRSVARFARGSKPTAASTAVSNPPASGGSSSDLFDDLLVEEAAPQAVRSASHTLSKPQKRLPNTTTKSPLLVWGTLGLLFAVLIAAAAVWGLVAHRQSPVDPSHVALLMTEAEDALQVGELSLAYEKYGRALDLLGKPDPSDIAAVESRARAIAARNEIVKSLTAQNRATEAAQAPAADETSELTAEQQAMIRHAQQLQVEWKARQSASRLQQEQPVRRAAQRWLTKLRDSNGRVFLGATELPAIDTFAIEQAILDSTSAVVHADVAPRGATALSTVRFESWELTLRLVGEKWTVVRVDVAGEGVAPASPTIADTPASGPPESVEELAADAEHEPSDTEPDDGGEPVAQVERDESPEGASPPPQSPTLSGLPRPPVAQPSPSPPSSPRRTSSGIVVQLADGSNFELDRLLADVRRLLSEAPHNEESNDRRLTLTQSDSSDVPVAVFSYENAELQGPCWLYDQSGAPAFAAEYRQGKEHGLLVMVQDGRPVFVEQYKGGKLDGPCILFREDRPWIVPVYSDGVLQLTNIYDPSGTYERLVPGGRDESVPLSLLIRVREELDGEHQAGRQLSRSIKLEFDEQVKAYRKKRAKELYVQKRQNQRIRSAIRLEAGAALRGEIIRRHLRGQVP